MLRILCGENSELKTIIFLYKITAMIVVIQIYKEVFTDEKIDNQTGKLYTDIINAI